ncbi:MAG: hypothetical protein JNM62_05375 [Flavobacteriales bacterium]|nr:hypothetical protein [Flavobacteriales bacterium]
MFPLISIWGYIALFKCTLVLTSLVFWLVSRRMLGAGATWLGLQLLAAVCAEGIATWLSFQSTNNMRVYDVYLVVEFPLLLLFTTQSWKQPQRTGALVVCALCYAFVLVQEFPHAWVEQEFLAAGYAVGGSLLVMLAIISLFQLALRSHAPIARVPAAWMLLGIAIFFGGSIPLMGLTNVLIEREVPWAPNMYFINDALFTLRYGSVIIAAMMCLRTRQARI